MTVSVVQRCQRPGLYVNLFGKRRDQDLRTACTKSPRVGVYVTLQRGDLGDPWCKRE